MGGTALEVGVGSSSMAFNAGVGDSALVGPLVAGRSLGAGGALGCSAFGALATGARGDLEAACGPCAVGVEGVLVASFFEGAVGENCVDAARMRSLMAGDFDILGFSNKLILT